MNKALTNEGGAPSSTLQNKISRDITKLTFIRKVLLLCLLQSIITYLPYVIKLSTNENLFIFEYMLMFYLFCFFILSFYFLHPFIFYPINYIVLLIVTVSEIIFFDLNLGISSGFSITLYSLCLIYSLFIKSRFRIWIPCTLFLAFVFTYLLIYLRIPFYYFEGWKFLIFTPYFATRLRYYMTCYEEKKLNWVICALMIIIDSPHHLFVSISIIFSILEIRLIWALGFCYVRIVINLIQYLLNIKLSSIGGDFSFPIDDCVYCWNNKELKGYQSEEAINEVSTLV